MWSAGTLASDPALPGGGGTSSGGLFGGSSASGSGSGGHKWGPGPGTKGALNPVTGQPYHGGGTYSIGGQYGGTETVGPEFTSTKALDAYENSHGMPGGSGYGIGFGGGGGGGYGVPAPIAPAPSGGGSGGGSAPNGGWQFHPNSITDMSMAKGGRVKAFAEGGDAGDPSSQPVPPPAFDDGGVIPDGQGQDAQAQQAQDPTNDQMNQPTDQGQQNQAQPVDWDAVQQLYNQHKQAMMSSKPAGPGGDQPNTNPFPTKTPSPAFGQKTGFLAPTPKPNPNQPPPKPPFVQEREGVLPAGNTQMAAADARPIPPAPGGRPPQGTLPPAPINPRDFLPGGSKASQGVIPTQVG